MSDNDITRKIHTRVDDTDTEGNLRRPRPTLDDAETALKAKLDDADTEGNRMKRPKLASVEDADVEGHVRFRNEGPVDDASQIRSV